DEPLRLCTRKRRGNPAMKWMRLALGLPIILLVWYFVIRSLVGSFKQIEWGALHVSYSCIATSVLCLLLARLMNGMNCTLMLRALGERALFSQVVPVIWVSSLGRYVPGKMAVVAGATYGLIKTGVGLPAALAGLFLSTALMILISLMTATPLLLTPLMREKLPWGWVPSLGVLLVGLICLQPGVFTRLCNLVIVRMKKPPLPARLSTVALLKGVGLTVLRSVFQGLGLWFAVGAIGALRGTDVLMAVGSAGLASTIGFVAVFAPAGLGVHEAVYLVTLGPVLGPKAAVLAVLFRLLHITADATAGGLGMILLRGQVVRETVLVN
ncbi:MAG: lysylphosphatidylglycerol synthase domain-containing protein, partial [Bacillota bacterium]